MAFASGSLTTVNDTVVITKAQTDSFVIITLSGTFSTATVIVEGAITGDTVAAASWALVSFVDRSLFARDTDDSLASLSTSKTLEVNGSGLKYIRVKLTAITSGTITVVMNADDVNPLTQLGGG